MHLLLLLSQGRLPGGSAAGKVPEFAVVEDGQANANNGGESKYHIEHNKNCVALSINLDKVVLIVFIHGDGGGSGYSVGTAGGGKEAGYNYYHNNNAGEDTAECPSHRAALHSALAEDGGVAESDRWTGCPLLDGEESEHSCRPRRLLRQLLRSCPQIFTMC